MSTNSINSQLVCLYSKYDSKPAFMDYPSTVSCCSLTLRKAIDALHSFQPMPSNPCLLSTALGHSYNEVKSLIIQLIPLIDFILAVWSRISWQISSAARGRFYHAGHPGNHGFCAYTLSSARCGRSVTDMYSKIFQLTFHKSGSLFISCSNLVQKWLFSFPLFFRVNLM